MNINSIKFFLTLLIALVITTGSFAQADKPVDPAADAMLKAVTEKYKKHNTAKIKLELVIDIPEVEGEEVIDVLTWLKGDKFKIELPDQLFISDNVTLWNYMPEYDEVQINNFEESDALFSPSVIFDMYSDAYIYRMKESYMKGGQKFEVIELVPVDKEQEFFKIDLTINAGKMEISQSKIYEKSGTHYIYRILEFTPNVSLTDDFFYLDTDKIETVVDLRY